MRRMIAVGSWLLGKFARGPYADAVAGDLAEGVQAGRSAGWYWGQVAMAMAAAWRRGLGTRAGRVLFVLGWTAMTRTWAWQHFIVEPIFWPVNRWVVHYEAEHGLVWRRLSLVNFSTPLIWGMVLVTVFLAYRVLRGSIGQGASARRTVWGVLGGLGLWVATQYALLGLEMTALFSHRRPVRASLLYLIYHPVWANHAAVEWLWRPLLMAASLYLMIAWALPAARRGNAGEQRGVVA